MERGPETSKDINPATAFAIVVAILVVIGLTWFFVRPEAAEPVPATPSPPDFSLTDEEAIARFKELEDLKIRAYRTRDLSLLPLIFTEESPSKILVEEDFEKLRRSGISFRSGFKTSDLAVLRNESNEIVIRQTVFVSPRLLDSTGADVTKGGPRRQVVDWFLRLEDDAWLVYETVVEKVDDV